MLNNITNFFNLIKTGKVKTQLDATDLLPIGTRDLRFSGQYQPTMIKYGDFISGLVGGSNGQVLFNDNDTIAGASTFYWDKVNNRVGIGTSTPANTLDINGTARVSGLLTTPGGVNLNGWYLYANGTSLASIYGGSNWIFETGSGGGYRYRTFGGVERMRLESSGNLLINTTIDSGFTLDVNGTARVGTLRLNSVGDTIEFNNTLVRIKRSSNRMNFEAFDGFDFTDTNISTTRIRIFGTTGNVGINTTTDAGFRLDVNGTARVKDVGSELSITSPLSAIAPVIFTTKGASGGYRGGYNFKGGFGGTAGNTIFIIDTGNTDATSRAGIGNFAFSDLASAKFSIDNTQSGGRNAAIRLRANFANTSTEYNGIDFNAYTGTDIGGFIGSQRNTATSGFGADIVVLATQDAAPSTYLEIARFMGRYNSFYVGTDRTLAVPSAKMQIESTTQGFLPPRMTTTEKNAIVSPAAGLMVYDNTLNRPCFYNGTSWITL